MSRIDELVNSLVKATAPEFRLLGVDEARQVYETASANPDLREDLLPLFDRFDPTARQVLANLFNPAFENSSSIPLIHFALPPDVDLAALKNTIPIEDPCSAEITLEVKSLNPALLIQAMFGGSVEQRPGPQMLSALGAFETYNDHVRRYQDTNKLDDLVAAAELLERTADAMGHVEQKDAKKRKAQQVVQYSFYEKVLKLCNEANEHEDSQRSGEYSMQVLSLKKGAKIKMSMLGEKLAGDKLKGGGGNMGGAAPGSGPAPMSGFGAGSSGIAATSIPFQNTMMASALCFASLALPIV